METLVQVYGLHNGKKILQYADVNLLDFRRLTLGKSVVIHGRHWWLV